MPNMYSGHPLPQASYPVLSSCQDLYCPLRKIWPTPTTHYAGRKTERAEERERRRSFSQLSRSALVNTLMFISRGPRRRRPPPSPPVRTRRRRRPAPRGASAVRACVVVDVTPMTEVRAEITSAEPETGSFAFYGGRTTTTTSLRAKTPLHPPVVRSRLPLRREIN